jgi:hypothetical protein
LVYWQLCCCPLSSKLCYLILSIVNALYKCLNQLITLLNIWLVTLPLLHLPAWFNSYFHLDFLSGKQVTMERDEMQDENGVLRKEISELQNELTMRVSGSPAGWGHGTARSDPPLPHSTAVFSSEQAMQPPTIASVVFPLQQPLAPSAMTKPTHAAPPLELKLFPEVASAEGHEPCEDHKAPNHVARPQARYPTQSASWPVNLFSGLPRMEDEQCSSSTSGSSREDNTDIE